MSLRVKQVLNLPPGALLVPANRKKYTPEDDDRVFSEQPFEGDEPPRCFIPNLTTTLRPPLLRYAWQIPGGYDRFMEIVFEHFPFAIDRWECDDFQGPGSKGCSKYPGREGWVMSIFSTASTPPISYALCEYLEIPERFHVVIKFVRLEDSKGNVELSLSICNNYHGVLADESREKLKELFGFKEDPKWYLDLEKWRWGRVHQSKCRTAKTQNVDHPVET